MSIAIDKIPGMTLLNLKKLRVNALRLLKDPKRGMEAEEMLFAIDDEIAKRTLPGMIVNFCEVFPGGFYGEKYAEEERDDKVAATKICQELLKKDDFIALLESEDWDGLIDRFTTVLNATNFLPRNVERAKWIDQVKSSKIKGKFFQALFELLHGSGRLEDRFGNYLGLLADIKFLKWTSATYFLFLHQPEDNMFVKPEMLKKSIELSSYPLDYESTPSFKLYKDILIFSDWLKNKTAELNPRDMIDIHSFMWHMAPTGKWSND